MTSLGTGYPSISLGVITTVITARQTKTMHCQVYSVEAQLNRYISTLLRMESTFSGLLRVTARGKRMPSGLNRQRANKHKPISETQTNLTKYGRQPPVRTNGQSMTQKKSDGERTTTTGGNKRRTFMTTRRRVVSRSYIYTTSMWPRWWYSEGNVT